MRIFLDGLIFSMQRRGGISRLYTEVLPRLLTMAPDLEVVLYLRRKLRGGVLPSAPRLEHLYEGSIYPRRWIYGKAWAQSQLLTRAYRRASPDFFQASYFSLPAVLRTPYVVTVYDTMDEIYATSVTSKSHNKLLQLRSKCIRLADLVFSISNSTTADILHFHNVDAGKIVTIHLGVSPQFRVIREEGVKQAFRQRFGLDRPFFLYVGNRGGVKNFRRLLHAYAYSNCGKDIDLAAVGGEPTFTEQEQIIIREYRLETSVKHLPDLDDENLAIAYNMAEAFLYPSLYEGFGLPVLEAMASGAPVITSKVASIPEVAGEAALYVEPEEIGEIAAALNRITQKDCRTQLVDAGLRQARRFSWDATARSMLDGYRKLV